MAEQRRDPQLVGYVVVPKARVEREQHPLRPVERQEVLDVAVEQEPGRLAVPVRVLREVEAGQRQELPRDDLALGVLLREAPDGEELGDRLLGAGEAAYAQLDFIGTQAEVLLFVALMFWAIAFTMSRLSARIETRLGVGQR